ncbi:MAG: hypothetical protein J0I06_13020 [Planctomycetes bacterium]|nr:hypothetical protein [Planctomycetota bacterium]
MSATIPDLWPQDLFTTPTVTPVAVLRQQGETLGARTHNFVRCEVDTESNADGTIFTHKLMLVAPFLRYRAPLLMLHHKLQPYPATLENTPLTGRVLQAWHRAVNNEQELREALREYFNQDRVKEIIRAVNNMSNDAVSEPYGI